MVTPDLNWDRRHDHFQGREKVKSLVKTDDHGYSLLGYTQLPPYYSITLAWMVETNADGTSRWGHEYGFSLGTTDMAHIKTADGGYAMAGRASGTVGGDAFALAKVTGDGPLEWIRTYPSDRDSGAVALVQTEDEGYALVGSEGDPEIQKDIRLVVTDEDGNLEWEEHYDIRRFDAAKDIVIAWDEGFAIACNARSVPDFGASDIVLLILDEDGDVIEQQEYDTGGDDWARSLIRTADEGYSLAGSRDYYSLLLKTAADGELEWRDQYLYQGVDSSAFAGIPWDHMQLPDEGYALGGRIYLPTNSPSPYVLVTDPRGEFRWDFALPLEGQNLAHRIAPGRGGNQILLAGYDAGQAAEEIDFWLGSVEAT